jgi:wyosine [tRNA(Phe)-imidazoG37] synthetase (radical SAM superfamily)
VSVAEKLEPLFPPRTDITYGPFQSERLGRTLGINILGDKTKICSLNCAYCDLGSTETRLNRLKETGFLPSTESLLEAMRVSFRQIHEHGPTIDTVCISGNGEPTLHPDFSEIVGGILSLRDLWLKGKKIAVLTNGASLDQRKIVEAMNRVDERIVKVDAGNERVFKLLNAPLARVNLAKILSGIRSLKDVTVQSMFCQGAVDNTLASDVDDWIEVIAMMKPKTVHIQGVSRTPAMTGIKRCDEDTLHTIASRLERRAGIKALITP